MVIPPVRASLHYITRNPQPKTSNRESGSQPGSGHLNHFSILYFARLTEKTQTLSSGDRCNLYIHCLARRKNRECNTEVHRVCYLVRGRKVSFAGKHGSSLSLSPGVEPIYHPPHTFKEPKSSRIQYSHLIANYIPHRIQPSDQKN